MSKYTKLGIKNNGIEQKFEDYWPLHNGILMKRHNVVDKTASGIIVPEEAMSKARAMVEDDLAYEVLKVGPEIVNVKVGDYVVLSMDSQYVVRLEDGPDKEDMYYQVFENLIIGLFRKNAKVEDFGESPAIVEMSTRGLKRS